MDDEALIKQVLGGNDHEANLLGRRGHKRGSSELSSDLASLLYQDSGGSHIQKI